MICPICKQAVPFGLPMHMAAAHGPKSAEYQRRSEELAKEATSKTGRSTRGKRRRGKPPTKLKLKYPRNSKLS